MLAGPSTHLAETLEVLGEADLLPPLRFALGLRSHSETSELHQQQVLRKVIVNLLFLQWRKLGGEDLAWRNVDADQMRPRLRMKEGNDEISTTATW